MNLATHTRKQAQKFVVVGLVSNIVLYFLYIGSTSFGVGHKTAMTILFTIGVLQTFVLNKRWTFAAQRSSRSAFLKYATIYGLAYVLNLSALLLFVDRFGFPHELVQGVAIGCLAILLFLLQKYWVFTPNLVGLSLTSEPKPGE